MQNTEYGKKLFEVFTPKHRLLLGLGVLALALINSAFMYGLPDMTNNLDKIIAASILTMFNIGIIAYFYIDKNYKALIVYDNGIQIRRRHTKRYDFVPWSELEHVTLRWLNNGTQLWLFAHVPNPEKYFKNDSRPERFLAFLSKLFFKSPLHVEICPKGPPSVKELGDFLDQKIEQAEK